MATLGLSWTLEPDDLGAAALDGRRVAYWCLAGAGGGLAFTIIYTTTTP